MSTFEFSCQVDLTDTDCPLEFSIIVDEQIYLPTTAITEKREFKLTLNEDTNLHKMKFVMSGKNINDTTLDADGNIIKNPMLVISNMCFEAVCCDVWIIDNSQYLHSFNGTQDEIVDLFGGSMGCNGTVSFEFATPIYVWLLGIM